jgi:hypothetical protein
MIQEVH